MTLIENNLVTEQFDASSRNLNAVLGIKEHAKTEEVVTEVSLACIEEIQKSQLGWGHSVKKFLATTFTYASVLALPVVALVGTIWHYFEQIKNLTALYEAKNLAFMGSGLGALLLANFAIGKVFGTKPINAILIAAYDAYRQGAHYLSKQVRDSYTSHELKMAAQVESSQQTIMKQLSSTYLGIALELTKRHKEGKLQGEVETLKTNLPIISKALSQVGLSKVGIREILSPLEDALKLIKTAA